MISGGGLAQHPGCDIAPCHLVADGRQTPCEFSAGTAEVEHFAAWRDYLEYHGDELRQAPG
jgi:hypothetical protein